MESDASPANSDLQKLYSKKIVIINNETDN